MVGAPFLFANETDTLNERDPVAPAQPTPAAIKKKASKKTSRGERVHGLKTLLRSLSTIVKNTCELANGQVFYKTTRPTSHQSAVLKALEAM